MFPKHRVVGSNPIWGILYKERPWLFPYKVNKYLMLKSELEEEIGYKAGKLTYICKIHPAIGFAS